MDSNLRDSVDSSQRHSVTGFRSNPVVHTVGQRIRQRRKKLGITRRQLADNCGMPYSTLADIENERQQSSTVLHVLARELRTTPEWLDSESGPEDLSEAKHFVLSHRERELILAFRNASDAVRRAIEGAAGIKTEPPAKTPKANRAS